MLMFVFGAGASYDSDPSFRPDDEDDLYHAGFRPPLATMLFEPDAEVGREAIAAFKRAAPLIMRLRAAARNGLDVEQVLEQLQEEGASFAHSETQLLALRAYLSRLLTNIPDGWSEQCQGLTNYVLTLDEVGHWQAQVDPSTPFACVSFNYDTLLEDAAKRVFGWPVNKMSDYVDHEDVRLFKPHGSVNWRQVARWSQTSIFSGEHALEMAIDRAAELDWVKDAFFIPQTRDESYQVDRDPGSVGLPALTIPAQNKSSFMMPTGHHEALIEALQEVDTLVAVGWRAREQHFLRLLFDHLPSRTGRLVVVSESVQSAEETLENLWEIGRFGSYAISPVGFSGFVETPAAQRPTDDAPRLRDVLTPGAHIWTNRDSGRGTQPKERTLPLAPAIYT